MSADAFEQAWSAFAGTVLAGLGPRELKAAREVFYAGGWATLNHVTDEVAAGNAQRAALDALKVEFVAFFIHNLGPNGTPAGDAAGSPERASADEITELRSFALKLSQCIQSTWKCLPADIVERFAHDETIASENRLPSAVAWLAAHLKDRKE
jgi:hypothetical protein